MKTFKEILKDKKKSSFSKAAASKQINVELTASRFVEKRIKEVHKDAAKVVSDLIKGKMVEFVDRGFRSPLLRERPHKATGIAKSVSVTNLPGYCNVVQVAVTLDDGITYGSVDEVNIL